MLSYKETLFMEDEYSRDAHVYTYGNIKKDKMRNKDILFQIGIVSIKESM